MDCILQRDDSLDDFLSSWKKYSSAVIAFAESHKSLKKCLRATIDDEEDACSECLHCRCILCTLHNYADSLTALRCLGYFLSSKQKKKDSPAKFTDVPWLLMEPPVCSLRIVAHN